PGPRVPVVPHQAAARAPATPVAGPLWVAREVVGQPEETALGLLVEAVVSPVQARVAALEGRLREVLAAGEASRLPAVGEPSTLCVKRGTV
ncbi:MAG: hypothetical protein WBM46_07365, partial [Polyangiales bacterium]